MTSPFPLAQTQEPIKADLGRSKNCLHLGFSVLQHNMGLLDEQYSRQVEYAILITQLW